MTPGTALGTAIEAIRGVEATLGKPASLNATFQGAAQAFQSSLATQPYLIAAAIVVVYLILGMLYESYIHPVTILSTLPSAGVGAPDGIQLRPQRDCAGRNYSPYRDRQEERDHDDRLRPRRGAQAGPLCGAVDLSGVPAALPAHHDDHHGGVARRRSADAQRRRRRRLGTSKATRLYNRGGSAAEPVAHALYDPDRLSLSRSDHRWATAQRASLDGAAFFCRRAA